MLGSIVAFALGLNLPRAVLLSGIALAGHSVYLLLRKKPTGKDFSLSIAIKDAFQGSHFGAQGDQSLIVFGLLITFGLLVTSSNLINGQFNTTSAIEYLTFIPICIALAASKLNQATPRELTQLVIAYSVGSLIYVLACLINTRLQGDLGLFSLFYKQSHNELVAPWGHLNNAVNLRTIEQSLLFPLSLLPISIVAFSRWKAVSKGWFFPLLTGTLALFLSRAFNSYFPLVALSMSSALTLVSLAYTQHKLKAFLLKYKKLLKIFAATLITTIAGFFLTSKGCIIIDERFSRVAGAIRHLPLLPQAATGLSFSYHEVCTNKSVTFASTAGDSLHNVFLDYSLQSGLVAGVALFACTVLLTARACSKSFPSSSKKNQANIDQTLNLTAVASVIGTSWILWLFQPISSSNFSMFLCSLYFLALGSSAVLTPPKEELTSKLKN